MQCELNISGARRNSNLLPDNNSADALLTYYHVNVLKYAVDISVVTNFFVHNQCKLMYCVININS